MVSRALCREMLSAPRLHSSCERLAPSACLSVSSVYRPRICFQPSEEIIRDRSILWPVTPIVPTFAIQFVPDKN